MAQFIKASATAPTHAIGEGKKRHPGK